MKKYVVKNCQLYTELDSLKNTCASLYTCESNTDCLIKQIIEKCKKDKKTFSDGSINPYSMGRDVEASQILEFFSIQEVE